MTKQMSLAALALSDMTQEEFEEAGRELCDMGLAYEKDGRFFAVPGIQVLEVTEDGGMDVIVPMVIH